MINAYQIRRWTDHDPLMSQVRQLVQHGWQWNNNTNQQPLQRQKDDRSEHTNGQFEWWYPTGARGATSGPLRYIVDEVTAHSYESWKTRYKD